MSEALVKTNPNTIDPCAVGRSTAPGELTSGEVAAALHGAHDGIYYSGMIHIAGQGDIHRVARYIWLNKSGNYYNGLGMDANEIHRGKDKDENGFLYQLGLIAAAEYLLPFTCSACQGREGNDCTACGGTKKNYPNDGQKAVMLGVSTDRMRYWQSFSDKCYNVVSSWAATAQTTVDRYLEKHE